MTENVLPVNLSVKLGLNFLKGSNNLIVNSVNEVADQNTALSDGTVQKGDVVTRIYTLSGVMTAHPRMEQKEVKNKDELRGAIKWAQEVEQEVDGTKTFFVFSREEEEEKEEAGAGAAGESPNRWRHIDLSRAPPAILQTGETPLKPREWAGFPHPEVEADPQSMEPEVRTVMENHVVYASRNPDPGKAQGPTHSIPNQTYNDRSQWEKNQLELLWRNVNFGGHTYKVLEQEFENDGLYRSSSGPSNTFIDHHRSLIGKINRALERLGAGAGGGGMKRNTRRRNTRRRNTRRRNTRRRNTRRRNTKRINTKRRTKKRT